MRVAALYVYPVKACGGVAVEEAVLGELGLAQDRRFAFIDSDGRALTQRDQPLLATIRPALENAALRLDFGGLFAVSISLAAFKRREPVDVWSKRVPARSAAEIAKVNDYLGSRVRLAALDQGAERAFVDSKPVLVTTTGMLAALDIPGVGMERFRPNVVLEGDGAWRELRGPDAVLEHVEPCSRCEVTTIDQASGARRGPEPLATLTARFDGNFGAYCRVTRPGRLRRGELLQAT